MSPAVGPRHYDDTESPWPEPSPMLGCRFAFWRWFYKHNRKWEPTRDPLEIIFASLTPQNLTNQFSLVQIHQLEIVKSMSSHTDNFFFTYLYGLPQGPGPLQSPGQGPHQSPGESTRAQGRAPPEPRALARPHYDLRESPITAQGPRSAPLGSRGGPQYGPGPPQGALEPMGKHH